MATQSGTTKKVAAAGSTVEAPCFQTIDVVAGTTTYTLSHAPKAGTTPKAYVLNGDGTLGEKITIDTTATGKKIAINGTTITLVVGTNGFEAGSQIFLMYDYIADGSTNNGAVEVVNSAVNFPVGCKFIMEILGVTKNSHTFFKAPYICNEYRAA